MRRLRSYAHHALRLVADLLVVAVVGRGRGGVLLLVRLDAIGDFVVWASCLPGLRKRFAERRAVLVVSEPLVPLARELGLFDEVLGVAEDRLRDDLLYRMRIMRTIRQLGATDVINFCFARKFETTDSIVRVSGSDRALGVRGDVSNTTHLKQAVANRWYSGLFDALDAPDEEYSRNLEFARWLGVPEPQDPLAWCRSLLRSESHVLLGTKPCVVLFPGAGRSIRLWPVERFAEVGRHCLVRGYDVVICGGREDVELADDVVRRIGEGARSLAGQTSIAELIRLVSRSALVVASETSIVHIAAAVSTPSICILGGGHFGRFVPYPNEFAGVAPHPVFHDMPCFGCNWQCSVGVDPDGRAPCVSKITTRDVLQAFDVVVPRA